MQRAPRQQAACGSVAMLSVAGRSAAVRAVAWAAAGSAWAMSAAPAWAQFAGDRPLNSVLPATGFGVQNGTLQQQLERVQPGGGVSLQPGLRVDGSIGIDVGVTDNPGGLNGKGTSANSVDGLISISPAVNVSGETPHLRVSLGYAPIYTRYVQTTNQNRLDQNLFGTLGATVVPEAFYINSNASITNVSRTGSTFYDQQQLFGNTNNINRNNDTTVYSFSTTPFVVHRFGGTGTGQVGATLSYTSEGNLNGGTNQTLFNQPFSNNQAFNNQAFNNQAFGGLYANSQPLTTYREFARFTTGEDFGRFNSATQLEATQYGGGGVNSNAHRNIIADDLSYAITHSIAALGRIGYEDIRYSGFPPTRISDILWRVGVRLTPNNDSQIVLGYGRQDGVDSFFANGYYTPTARTRLTVTYSTGIETDLEDFQNATVVSQYDPGGGSYDAQTGGPISSGLGFSGINNNLFRLTRASGTLSLNYDRDTYAFTLTSEQRTVIAAASQQQTGLLGSTQNSLYGSVTWEHQLTPVLNSTLGVSVGQNTYGGQAAAQGFVPGFSPGFAQAVGQGNTSQTTVGLNAGLFYSLSPTVTTSARYNFQTRSGVQNALSNAFNNGFNNQNNGTENTFFLGLRKSF